MNKVKLLFSLGLLLLGACSDNDSNSTNAQSESDTWKEKYSAFINEEEGVIGYNASNNLKFCRLNPDNTVEWASPNTDITITMSYKIDNGKLYLIQEDEEEDFVDTTIFLGNNSSIYGVWNSANNDKVLKITENALYTSWELEDVIPVTEPVEADVDLASSYFLLDLIRCSVPSYTCAFSHWHFTKDAHNSVISIMQDQDVEILDKGDRFLDLTIQGQEFTIRAENVQEKEDNDEHEFYSAYIESEGKSCHYKHDAGTPSKETCLNENIEGLFILTFEDEDGLIYSQRYAIDNSEEFSNCVRQLFEK